MEFEGKLGEGVVGGGLQGVEDDPLDVVALGGHRDRVPEADEQGFEPADDPEEIRIRGLDAHEDVVGGDAHPLRNGLDADGDSTLVLGDDLGPPFRVERETVCAEERLRFLDVLLRDPGAGQILLEEVLEAEEEGGLVAAPSALQVGVHVCHALRVLEEVAGLVGVGPQDQVVGHESLSWWSGLRVLWRGTPRANACHSRNPWTLKMSSTSFFGSFYDRSGVG